MAGQAGYLPASATVAVSMVVGYPADGQVALDPHSIHARQIGVHVILGGLLDGPVKKSIFRNLRLTQPDEYAPFNTSDVDLPR